MDSLKLKVCIESIRLSFCAGEGRSSGDGRGFHKSMNRSNNGPAQNIFFAALNRGEASLTASMAHWDNIKSAWRKILLQHVAGM